MYVKAECSVSSGRNGGRQYMSKGPEIGSEGHPWERVAVSQVVLVVKNSPAMQEM